MHTEFLWGRAFAKIAPGTSRGQENNSRMERKDLGTAVRIRGGWKWIRILCIGVFGVESVR